MADEFFEFFFPDITVSPEAPGDFDGDGVIGGGFGTGPFGSVPFGSTMPEEATSLGILFVEAIALDTIRINLTMHAVVNDDYNDVNNYILRNSKGERVEILNVIVSNNVTWPFIVLHTRNLVESGTYELVVHNIISNKGHVIDTVPPGTPSDFLARETELAERRSTSSFTYWRTKTDSAISSIPKIYDTTATSNLRALLTAIGLEDNIISGRRYGEEEYL
jgi:hypothetical protein